MRFQSFVLASVLFDQKYAVVPIDLSLVRFVVEQDSLYPERAESGLSAFIEDVVGRQVDGVDQPALADCSRAIVEALKRAYAAACGYNEGEAPALILISFLSDSPVILIENGWTVKVEVNHYDVGYL